MGADSSGGDGRQGRAARVLGADHAQHRAVGHVPRRARAGVLAAVHVLRDAGREHGRHAAFADGSVHFLSAALPESGTGTTKSAFNELSFASSAPKFFLYS